MVSDQQTPRSRPGGGAPGHGVRGEADGAGGRGRGSAQPSTTWTVLLGAVTLWWLVTRGASLRLGLWWDEAFTAQRYVREAPGTLLDADAYVANNHVLFSALTWITTRITGTSEPSLRLWAVVPAGVATAALVAWLWRRLGPGVAVLTAAITATSTLWLAMGTQARGYGLVVAAATALLLVVVHEDREPTWRGDLIVAVSGFAAMATFPPTVALYLAHTGVWLVRRRVARLRLVVLTAGVGVATALLYLPLVDLLFERADRVGSRFADPISWWSPVVAPLQLVGGPSFGAGSGLGPVSSAGTSVMIGSRIVELGVGTLPGIVALVLGMLGIVVMCVRADRPLGIHLLAGLGGSIVLLAPAGFHLADRYISFLLPHATVAIAVGLAVLCGALAPTSAGRSSRAGASSPRSRSAVAGVVVILGLVTAPVIWEASTTPLQAFADAAAVIRAQPDATIVVDSYHTGYRWYLDDLEVERITDQDELDARLCDPDGQVFFARHPDTPVLAVPGCLDGAHERRFEHQRAPGYLSLWVAQPSGPTG